MGRARGRGRRLLWLVMTLVALASLGGPPAAASGTGGEVDADWHTLRTPPLAPGQLELLTLSTLPDAVTAGDVLVAVRGLDAGAELTVTRDGVDVTSRFARQGSERRGLVSDLPVGPSTLEARSGDQVARLVVRNHPVTGPVLSGPHQTPFRCETQEAGLGPALDDDCSAAPRYQWFYRSSQDQGFHELADPYAPYPDDVVTTQTEAGDAVPFVVRVESRTINRGIARMAVLDDPAGRGPGAPFTADRWTHRVYYAFGESCGVGYHQGVNRPETVLGSFDLTEVSADNLLINLTGITDRLGKGDVTVHSTLTSFGVHCNPLVSVETAMMIKEHLSEQYGPVEAIVGTNGSGAALQQYNALNNAPGLLAAAMPTATFADIATTAMTVTDCGLLQRYYSTSELDWTDAKRAAVNGHNLLSGGELNAICQSWVDTFLDRIDPTKGCSVPVEQRYHPAENPSGVRCTIQDANVNVFGGDPETGFARRPLDNVGVQYGLAALRAGTISLAEFIDLNAKVGGYDIDGQPQAARHEMPSEVAALTYRIGGVIGRGALSETPVMDIAPYLDLIPSANIHEAVRPFVVRARLRARTDQSTTQSIWRGVLTQADAYPTMQDWLDGVLAARPPYGGDHQAAVAAARPPGAYDRCAFGTIGGRLELPAGITTPLGVAQLPLLPGTGVPGVDVPLRVDVPEDFDSGIGPCALALPVTATPRMVAGMPLSDDVIKCQRRPVARSDYPGGVTDAQLAEVRAIFPTGVCDYMKPAAEDVEHSMLWASVGGETLEPPHELHWRVARSSAATTAPEAGVAGAGSAERLPATGAGRLATPGLALAAMGLLLRHVRRAATPRR
jgi:hypothetical protein